MKSLGSLLVVSDRYPHAYDAQSSSFVKSQVDCIKNNFDKVYVISLTPIVPKFLTKFLITNPRWVKDAYAQDYEYDNVTVYFVRYFTLPLEFFRGKKGIAAFREVHKIIENNNINFNLIHAHFTYPSGYVSAKLKKIYNKPVVLTVHEDRNWFLKEINNRNAVYSWHNANKIIRVNKGDLKEFHRSGIDESKLMSLPNGFFPNLFKPIDSSSARIELGLPVDKKIILNIANLEEHKGQRYLIESMKNILVTHSDVMLYIVGQGSLRHDLQMLIDMNGLQNKIILAGGNKPAEEIPLWMNACDVFVLSSLSESFGIVQIEAMACGKPVVATRNGGSEEIIINEKLGILTEPKDVCGMEKAILKALDTKWYQEYIIKYSMNFIWDIIAERIVEVYGEILQIE